MVRGRNTRAPAAAAEFRAVCVSTANCRGVDVCSKAVSNAHPVHPVHQHVGTGSDRGVSCTCPVSGVRGVVAQKEWRSPASGARGHRPHLAANCSGWFAGYDGHSRDHNDERGGTHNTVTLPRRTSCRNCIEFGRATATPRGRSARNPISGEETTDGNPARNHDGKPADQGRGTGRTQQSFQFAKGGAPLKLHNGCTIFAHGTAVVMVHITCLAMSCPVIWLENGAFPTGTASGRAAHFATGARAHRRKNAALSSGTA